MYKNTKEILDSFPTYQGSSLINTRSDITEEQIKDVLLYGYQCTIADGMIFFTLKNTRDVASVIEECLKLDMVWYSNVATKLNFLSIDYDIRLEDLIMVSLYRNASKSSFKKIRDEIIKILGGV